MTFEWDENKNAENIKKHNVSFDRAQRAFEDPDLIIVEDDDRRYTDAPPEVDAALDYAIKHNRFLTRQQFFDLLENRKNAVTTVTPQARQNTLRKVAAML